MTLDALHEFEPCGAPINPVVECSMQHCPAAPRCYHGPQLLPLRKRVERALPSAKQAPAHKGTMRALRRRASVPPNPLPPPEKCEAHGHSAERNRRQRPCRARRRRHVAPSGEEGAAR
eukprot:scaffold249020_cov28-Tisochrysis_lutea.AAC.1